MSKRQAIRLILGLWLTSTTGLSVASTPAEERDYPGTLGFQLGLKAIHSYADDNERMTRRTRRLFDEAIAVLEREIEEDGYIDPVNQSDRVGILYALYESCGYWDKALALFEKVLEEGDTDSVRYQMAENLLPRVREQAQAAASKPRFVYLFLVAACAGVLLLLSRRRRA